MAEFWGDYWSDAHADLGCMKRGQFYHGVQFDDNEFPDWDLFARHVDGMESEEVESQVLDFIYKSE